MSVRTISEVESIESDLAQNLRTLCSARGTIAEICRKIGISRQQFNKYLAGQHQPSRANLNLICQYFGVEAADLYLTPARFDALYEKQTLPQLDMVRRSPFAAQFLRIAAHNIDELRSYCGIYERFHSSSIYRGQILKSIVYIYEKDRSILHTCIERFQNLDDPQKARYIFKYRGVCTLLEGRIFMTDFDSVGKNEITSSILIPQKRSSKEFLFGITMGIAATLSREPYAARVALRYCGDGPLTASTIRRSRTLDPSDPAIPVEVRQYLSADTPLIRGN